VVREKNLCTLFSPPAVKMLAESLSGSRKLHCGCGNGQGQEPPLGGKQTQGAQLTAQCVLVPAPCAPEACWDWEVVRQQELL
jgi:hypothetical protein